MKTKLILAALAAAAPLTAADAMNVAVFLDKAGALEKRGPLALFSSDYKLLKREVQTASEQLRAERLAAQHAGLLPAGQGRRPYPQRAARPAPHHSCRAAGARRP